MDPANNKPSIFISSTIFDFADMRSSLKYYLERLGYTVNMSEFNDFQHDLDKNSYDACFKTVENSDYFILLIGSRAGGLYSKASNATITQMEYRAAYEKAKQGKTRILAFVRKDVWTIIEERGDLARHLKGQLLEEKEITEVAADKIPKLSSKFATDAGLISAFIAEVCRKDEMKAAAKGEGELPVANWVHQFATFGDIVACLRVQFNIGDVLERKKVIDGLADELLSNLATML